MERYKLYRRGDTPPDSLDGVTRVVIHQPSRDPSRAYTGGEYSSTVEYVKWRDKWMPYETTSADFGYCKYSRIGFVNGGCKYCPNWIENEESPWNLECFSDRYPERAEEDLTLTDAQVLDEIRRALEDRDFDVQVTLFYGNGED